MYRICIEDKMPRIPIHKQPNAGTQGFKQNPQNIQARRKASATKKFERILTNTGHIRISKKNIIAEKETDTSIYVKMPNAESLAHRLYFFAYGKDIPKNVALKALIEIRDQIIGKPKDTIEIQQSNETPIINLGCSDCPHKTPKPDV